MFEPLPARAVMGIVNVTPDSFSDGGQFLDADAAVAHGAALAAAGADVVDVGGESTRPGAQPVSADDELRRVLPVVEALAGLISVPVSIDTAKAAVAAACLDAGASIVNDVTAGRADDAMLETAAGFGAGFIAMHMRGEPRTMQDDPRYDDVVAEVTEFLDGRLEAARAAGIAPGHLIADPGIGFGKTAEHNLQLLAAVGEMTRRLGVPLLVGASRKSFIGRLLDAGAAECDDGTLATTVWAFERGAAAVRVHDVESAVRARALLSVIEDAEAA